MEVSPENSAGLPLSSLIGGRVLKRIPQINFTCDTLTRHQTPPNPPAIRNHCLLVGSLPGSRCRLLRCDDGRTDWPPVDRADRAPISHPRPNQWRFRGGSRRGEVPGAGSGRIQCIRA